MLFTLRYQLVQWYSLNQFYIHQNSRLGSSAKWQSLWLAGLLSALRILLAQVARPNVWVVADVLEATQARMLILSTTRMAHS